MKEMTSNRVTYLVLEIRLRVMDGHREARDERKEAKEIRRDHGNHIYMGCRML